MIKVENINKSFGKHTILKDISFSLDSGECVALVAPNGSGKTTLMSMIAGVIAPDTGKIVLADTSYQSKAFNRQVGFMQDNSVLYHYLTGYDHLAFVATAHDLPNQTVMDTAKMVGIDSFLYKKVSDYSLGMKQQLLFAIAILHNPKLLLLDEPFNGLDPSNLIKIRNIITDLNRERGTTVILSSHNLDEVDRIAQKIFFVKDKQIIERRLASYEQASFCITIEPSMTNRTVINGEWLSNQQLLVHKNALHTTLSQLLNHGYRVEDIEFINNGSERLFNEIYKQ